MVRAPARRRADDDPPASAEEAAGLRPLARSALRLIGALGAGSDEAALREPVADYVACAAERGISPRRIRDALELLVHEHAPAEGGAASGGPAAARCQATIHVLDLVLRLASEARFSSARQLREAV